MSERSIFLAVLDLPDPAERAAYLDRACGGDPGVRRGVEELLAAHGRSGTFMPAPAGGAATGDYVPAEGPGSRVGPYKLLQQIGEGGMGAVYMAEQEQPVRRMVALKIIREGLDSRAVLTRFEAERQALALMDHPNIAKVFDAGATESGRPYFVMELVKGVPITQFCDEHQLTLRERLGLFVPVCQAIQHAHQKGIIHRDIKPSNVLVALYDDKPVPKVIDFGVAKAASQKLTDRTLFTAFGQVVGTLEYMSPEQAKLNQLDIDTRSDVYALGVLLYELLTGTTPLDRTRLKAAALDEVLRLIREEEPERPSTRLSTAQARPAVAAARRAEPAQLGKVVRGELDWIVMKALEKDRTRRYETANGLARDVERYLKDEAVEACPPTLGYRLQKAYRKNRAAVGVAAAFLALLSAAAVTATVLAVRARQAERAAVAERTRAEQREAEANDQRERADRERQRAEKERQRAEEEKKGAQAVRDFLQDDLLRQADRLHQAQMRKEMGGDYATQSNPTVQELLERAALQLSPDRIDAKFPGMPFVQAEILKAVGDAYIGIREDAKGEQFLARAHTLHLAARGPDDPAALDAGFKLAAARAFNGRRDEAYRLLDQVLAGRTRVLGPYHLDTLRTRLQMEFSAFRSKGPAAMIPLLLKHRDDALAHLGPDHQHTLVASFYLGYILQLAGQVEEGFKEMEAVRAAIGRLKVRHDHPDIEFGVQMMFDAYRKHNRHQDAIAVLEETLAAREAQKCIPSDVSWGFRHSLASAYLRVGRKEEAIKVLTEGQNPQRFRKASSADTPETLRAIASLTGAYVDTGRKEEAFRLFAETSARLIANGWPLDERSLGALASLRLAVRRAGRFDLAAEMSAAIMAALRKLSDPPKERLARELVALGFELNQANRPAEAEPPLREAVQMWNGLDPGAANSTEAKKVLANVLLAQQKHAEAEPLLLAVYKEAVERMDAPAFQKGYPASTAAQLIEVYTALNKPDELKKWQAERAKHDPTAPKPGGNP